MRIFELMSSGPGDLFILRFWSFFKTIFSLNTIDMLLFGLMWSGKSHSVLDSLVKTLLNSLANISSCQYLSVEDLFNFLIYIYTNWVLGPCIFCSDLHTSKKFCTHFDLVTDISFFFFNRSSCQVS